MARLRIDCGSDVLRIMYRRACLKSRGVLLASFFFNCCFEWVISLCYAIVGYGMIWDDMRLVQGDRVDIDRCGGRLSRETKTETEWETGRRMDGWNVPLWFMLFEHLPLRVVSDDSDVDECAQVELLCAEGCVRHGCVATAERRSEGSESEGKGGGRGGTSVAVGG